MHLATSGARLRAGIVGASGIGRAHADALRRIGVDVVALAGSSPASARRVAAELRVPVACESVEALVARGDVDVVHVCTPNALHAEQVRLALAAGKHVVCEKPLASTAADAALLLAEAEASGRVHAVAYVYRFYPMVQAMRAAVAAGRLGRMHLLRGAYLADFVLAEDPGSWVLDPSLCGPALALADVGVHWWDLAEHVSGRRATAALCTRQAAREPGAPGEDSAAILLRLDGGAVASAVISVAAPGHGNTIELEAIGTRASLRWEHGDPDRLRLGALGAAEESWMRRAGGGGGTAPAMPAGHPHGYLDAFRDLIASVYARIAGGEGASHPTFADGLRGMRILEALLASAERAAWVDVDPSG
jgi:predicted dehydrogenase